MYRKKFICVVSNQQYSGLSSRKLNLSWPQQSPTLSSQSKEDVSKKIEWEKALPYNALPKETPLNMTKKFMPGGKLYKADLQKIMKTMRKEKGDIFVLSGMLGKPEMVITYDPADFETIYRNEGIWPSRPGSETLRYYREEYKKDFFQGIEGALPTHGEKWGTFRSAVNPVLMQTKNIKLYLDKMSDVNLEFIDRIRSIRDPKTHEMPANFEEEINSWTLESVAMIALDKHLGLLKDNKDVQTQKFFSNITEMFNLFFELEAKPSLWRYIPTPKYTRLMNIFDELQDVIMAHINESIESLEQEKNENINRPEHEKSVLEKLLKINPKIAIVMAMDMLLAGVDTTTTTLTGTLLCLAKNPQKQQKLREEVMKVLPEKDSKFSPNALNNIPYLRACIKESMRMYPLSMANARTPQNDVVLSGYQIPKDKQVIMVFSDLIRDEKYFPRPNEYIPERWLRIDKDKINSLRDTNPFLFLPFGFGPRMCLGKRIADLELEICISRLVRNFHIEYNYPTDNAFKISMINIPNIPLKFKFTEV